MRGALAALALACALAAAAGAQDLAPRVPAGSLGAARTVSNPLAATLENLARGRALYAGKGFCAACHGPDGRGFGADVDTSKLRGALPRDLGDPAWQAARSDGELFFVLERGVPDTAMAAFVPALLSETEAWQVLLYVRSLAR